jgi:hypothetical protein
MNCEKNINENFDIPFHIFEEIVQYVQKGKPSTKWNNIYTLIKMSECNHKISSSQAKYLIETYK